MTEATLFHEALAKPVAERAAFLDAACAGQPELRAAVDALLTSHEAAGSFLDQPAVARGEMGELGRTVDSEPGPDRTIVTREFTPEPDDAPPHPAKTTDYHPQAEPGAIIASRYTLVEKIGEGGMGEVWVVKQTEPVKRKVALKLIKAGMDTKAVLQRFDAERQALAMMDHPNIAKVLDGGMTGDRRPFFVMELVNGLPLTRFCDEAKLGIRERLELFAAICQAVQHAHQKGIIHRDLKPSNILVTLIDARPVPKVIDFGVAKAIGGKLLDESLSTQFGAVVGTFEYMSPEQAGFSGSDIDTRADIYSLGVILYELLTGLRPIDAKRLKKAALTEMLRIIQEEEPSKPSTRLSTDESLPSLAASRHIEPKKLMALLRGELDWVVMKCLEKQRERRYETANALARDVQRYLADEAVEARPPSAAYRLSKFLKRNKGPVLAAGVVFLALVAGIAGTSIGMVRAEQQRQLAVTAQLAEFERAEGERLAKRDAEHRRQEAETNLAYAKKGNEILGSVFFGLEPEQHFASVAELRNSLRDNLTRAVAELEGSAIGDPLEVAGMQGTLGLALQKLGEAEAAIAVFLKADKTYQSKLGASHAETLANRNNLAAAYQDAGQLDKAVPILEETLQGRKALFGAEHTFTLLSMSNLGLAYIHARRLDKALPLLEEALPLMKTRLGADNSFTLTCLNNLALGYGHAGRPDKAMPLLEESLRLKRATLREGHPLTLNGMANLAACYSVLKQHDKSIPLLEDAVKIMDQTLGRDHPTRLQTLANLGMIYMNAGRLAEAIPRLEEGYQARAKHHSLRYLAMPLLDAYVLAGQRGPAITLAQELVVDVRKELRNESPPLAARLALVGASLLQVKAYAEAEPLLRESLGIHEKAQPDAWTTFNTQSLLGGALLGQKKYAEAEPLLLKGYEGMKQREKTIPPQGKVRLAEAIEPLVQLYEATNRKDEAAKWRKELEATKATQKKPEIEP